MMGSNDQPGLIPNTCDALFNLQSDHNKAVSPITITYKVEISYSEIYAESVRDLLSKTPKLGLKVREHPVIGPYVENLTQILVEDFDGIKKLIIQGNKERITASTAMNNQSSRSHAILTVYFTQIILDPSIGKPRQVVSKINLVDLAGSERVETSEVEGIHFTEAININKSLTTLGNVISKLALQSKTKTKTKKTKVIKKPTSILKKSSHIPYRDSTLTWILKESLGGNSKTYMIATLSPSSINYNESISTLRYASNVKQIVNTVKVNEDPNDKLIRALKSEIDELRMQLAIRGSDANCPNEDLKVIREEISQREELMRERDRTWEQKLADSKMLEHQIREQHKKELEQQHIKHQQQIENVLSEKIELEKRLAELSQTPRDDDPALRTITTELLKHQEERGAELLKQQDEVKREILTKQEEQNAEVLRKQLEMQQELFRQQEEMKRAILEVQLNNNAEIVKKYEAKIDIMQSELDKQQLLNTESTAELNSIKIAHETSIKEIEELKTYNTKLKHDLTLAQRELQTQIRRFDEERTTQSKQIQQLKHKNHLLEIDVAKNSPTDDKYKELQKNCKLLDERVAQTNAELSAIEQKYKEVHAEITVKSHELDEIKNAYQELSVKIIKDTHTYEQLCNNISTIKIELDKQIECAKLELANPTDADLLKISEGFANILNKLKK
jgi:hypothetical protein